MCQSPSRDFTPARTSLNVSLPEGLLSSLSAPRSRQFKQSPLVSRETERHSAQACGSLRIANVESVGGPAFMGLGGFGAQGRAKITDLLVHGRLGFDRLCNFFPQESAISPPELMK